MLPETPETKTPKGTFDDFLKRYPNAAPKPTQNTVFSTDNAAQKPRANVFEFIANEKKPEDKAGAEPAPEFAEQETFGAESPRAMGYGEPSQGSVVQAKIVNRLSEMGLSSAAKMIAKSESRQQFKPDTEMQADVEYLMAVVIEDSGKKIPPGVLLLILIVVIWIPIFIQAFAVRKMNTEPAQPANMPEQDITGNNYTAEDVEPEAVEVVFDEEDYVVRLAQSNNKAREAGLTEFSTYQPTPRGYCRWFGMVEGRMVKTPHADGKFYSSTESGKYQALRINYKRYGLDFPGDWIKK